MSKQYLLSLLHAYQPTDAREIEAKQRIISFVEAYENCFERTLDVGHITASAWLLNKTEDKVLLMHHAKLNAWVQLGGHCDGEPNVLNVALKEAQEESGISHIVPISTEIFDIDVHLIPANSKEKEHYHYDIRFLFKVASNENFIQNHESKELRWIDKDWSSFPGTDQSVVRMFDKWLNLSNPRKVFQRKVTRINIQG